MSGNYFILQKCKKNIYIHNTNHGTVNIKIATKEILKYCYVFSLLQMSLHVTVYKASDGGLEAQYTK
jgi:hypothetical protein